MEQQASIAQLGRWLGQLRRRVTRSRADTLGFSAAGLLILAGLLRLIGVGLGPLWLGAAVGLVALGALGVLVRRLGFDWLTTAIVLSAAALYGLYLGYTSFGERNYDGGAQLEYLRYIIEHRALPPAAHCHVCHHPPLYYLLAAAVFEVARLAGLPNPPQAVQVLSLLAYLGLVVSGVALLKRFVAERSAVWVGAGLMAFWPYGVQHSARLHNDTLVAALIVAGLYALVRWQQDGRRAALTAAGVLTALALLTKTSGVILLITLLVVLGIGLWRSTERWALARQALPALVSVAVAVVYLGVVQGSAGDAGCDRLLGTACHIRSVHFVGNEPYNYLYFDLRSFLSEPYVLAEYDGSGRQLFWNHLLKSSLFGTANWVPDTELSYGVNRAIAGVLNVLLLGMTAFGLWGLVAIRRRHLERHVVLLVSVALSVALLMAFRIIVPAPHHTDFRHVFAALVPLATGYALTLSWLGRHRRALATVGYVLPVAFCLLSAVYYLPKYQWLMAHTKQHRLEQLESWSEPVEEGEPWDRPGRLCFDRNTAVEIRYRRRHRVSEVDISLDNNDSYELMVVGVKEVRRLRLGPSETVRKGLARYQVAVDPPVRSSDKVFLRPLEGDRVLCMGHLLLD